MILLLLITLAALTPLALVLMLRSAEAHAWRRSLVAYELSPPAKLGADDVAAWLAGINAMTHPGHFSLSPLPPVCLEIASTADGIKFYVLVVKSASDKLLSSLRATMPGARINEVPDYLARRPKFQVAAEATMTSYHRPLAAERAASVSASLLASLQPIVGKTTEIRMQWILTSAGTPAPVPTPKAARDTSAVWSWESTIPQDAEAVHAARAKNREPLLMGVARLGVAAENAAQAYALFGRVWNNLHGLNAPGVRIRRRWLPSSVVVDRLMNRLYPIVKWPMYLNSTEGAGLLALPLNNITLPGLSRAGARQLPPPPHMPPYGLVLGASNYVGMTSRPITLQTDDRLRHMAIVAPTGAGKSHLMAQMVLQDIRAGIAGVVIDPKGDLLPDILSRVSDEEAQNIVVLDASQRDQPIGLNVLGGAHDESSRELLVDNVLSIFRSIWADFWGPRSDSLCRMALTTLVHTKGADGSAMTLCELVPLLTNPSFRNFVVNQSSMPDVVRAYWQRYDAMSEGERQQTNTPLLNKVEAFTSRTPIRLMLGQSTGFDFADVFRQRKTVLISLAKGNIGDETANLLGSLLVMLLWQTTLARVAIPAAQRRPVFAYIDEAPDLMRLPIPLSDMVSQARGLGLGFVFIMQFIAQASQTIRAALLGTVRTQLSFAVELEDAVVLAQRFSPLTADDLQGLERFEAAVRACLGGVTASPVTLTTLPLPASTQDAEALASTSRQRFGTDRATVEAGLLARIQVKPDSSVIGRRRQAGGTT